MISCCLTLFGNLFGVEEQDAGEMSTSAVFVVVVELDMGRLFVRRLYIVPNSASFTRQTDFLMRLWIFERFGKPREVFGCLDGKAPEQDSTP